MLNASYQIETNGTDTNKRTSSKTKTCPFKNLPEARRGQWGEGLTAAEMKKCRWLKPRLVASIEYLERTPANHLRHPMFAGLSKNPRGLAHANLTIVPQAHKIMTLPEVAAYLKVNRKRVYELVKSRGRRPHHFVEGRDLAQCRHLGAREYQVDDVTHSP